MKRCAWPKTDLEIKYHDEEWGTVSKDNRYMFEMLVLEMMQAGLSWRTILEKRENYRKAFHNFEVDKILKMDDLEKEALFENTGIIRNKLKINAIFNNAKIVSEMKPTLSDFIWSYTDHKHIVNEVKNYEDVASSSDLSTKISNDLKKMGFKFVGPTIIYSYLHAIGMVDDHENTCDFKTKSQT